MSRRRTRNEQTSFSIENDDDEVRYDEIVPLSDARVSDENPRWQSQHVPNQGLSEISEKIMTRARFESRRTRQPVQVWPNFTDVDDIISLPSFD